MRDYGYRQNLGFLRFCDDPELACCQAEKDYLRLKAQENDLYSKAMSFEYDIAILQDENAKLRAADENDKLQIELSLLRKVVEAARDVVGFGACHDENSFWSIKALQNTVENYEGWKKEVER